MIYKWTVKRAETSAFEKRNWHVYKPHRIFDRHWVAAFATQAEAFAYAQARAERELKNLLEVNNV